jgi:hypothetical protein
MKYARRGQYFCLEKWNTGRELSSEGLIPDLSSYTQMAVNEG